ncbi:MAG: TRAP transporter substrate-binding protein [Gammaproteobacteria bacterium]|nr:TRAP transporter substrate-binding protein [Gammaproteobacteria bacterium]
MNKKFLITALTLIIIILLAFYFYTQKKSQSSNQLLKQQDKQTYQLHFGHNISTNSAMHKAAVLFAKEVKKRSNGKVEISIHPNQELGNDHQMVEMARAGELDILLTPTAKMSVPVPAMQFADLPFLFPSREDAYAVLDGEPGKKLLAKLSNIDLMGMAFWENGFKHFTANKSITRPEDFEGLKMRVMKSRIIMEQFKSLGAIPVPIDFHSTRQALADGVVDGQENPLVAIVSMKFYEVQSHMTLSNHAYLGYVLSFSLQSFDKLPENIKQILIDAVNVATPWQRQETQKKEADFITSIKKAGVIVEELTPEQRQRFAEKTRAIADEFKLIIGADILSKTNEIIQSRQSKNGE